MNRSTDTWLPTHGGETLQRLRAAAGTGGFLGDTRTWPPSLRTLATVAFSANQPMFIAWGPERRLLYNDAYVAILAERHPAAFGARFVDVWEDILPEIGPVIDAAFDGLAQHHEDLPLTMIRGGLPRQTWFSFSYTPIRGDDGEVEGVFCACTETTQHVLAEQERAAEEARRLMLFQQAPGFITVLRGPEHVFEFANDAYNRLAGGRELVGRRAVDAFPEVASQGLITVLDEVYASGQRFTASDMAVQLQPDPGRPAQERFLDFVYEPIVDADGQVRGVFVEGHDVTDAHHTREAREVARRRYRELLDAMGEGFMMLDEEFRVLEINATAERMGGRPLDQVLGRVHWDVWPTAAQTPVAAMYRRVMSDRSAEQLEYRHQGDGVDMWLRVRAYPVTGGIATLISDVTESMSARDAQRRSDDRFQAALDVVGVLWTNDANGRMTGPQPGWSALTGQTTDDYLGYGWAAAVHPDDADASVAAWREAVAERRTFVFEHRVRRRDGVYRRYAIRAVPILEPDGEVREWVGVHSDVTDAAEAAEALRQADRRKDEFLATLAHELRNPLAPIVSAAHLLSHDQLPRAQVEKCRTIIQRQARHMALLLDDLLDVARIAGGRLELRLRPVRLSEVVESALETAQPALRAREHAIEVALPPLDPDITVDPLRLAQVLTNLLTNAAKYTDPGGHVRLSAAIARGELVFEVSDDGIGIAADVLPEIFEMFRQVKGTLDRAEGGLGIGLALTRGLVELHGGRIEASSAGPGRGSTFRVVLPQAMRQVATGAPDDASPATAPPPSTASAFATATRDGRLRILVVDDNLDAATSLAMLLEASGFETHVAHRADEALAVAERVRPDVGLLDIGLPDLDGYELARRLRSRPWATDLRLAAVTGWGQDADRERALQAGFDLHLTKPIRLEEALDWLETPASGRDR